MIAAGLTAAMEGFLSSPAGGWVTSAPMNITGDWNTAGLMGGRKRSREGGFERSETTLQIINNTSSYQKAKNVRHTGNKGAWLWVKSWFHYMFLRRQRRD